MTHLYYDCVGDDCRLVEDPSEASLLVRVEGKVATLVHPEEEDEGLEIDVEDLTGELVPLKKPPRPLAGPVFEYTRKK